MENCAREKETIKKKKKKEKLRLKKYSNKNGKLIRWAQEQIGQSRKKKSGPVYRTIEILQPSNRQKILKKNKQSLRDMYKNIKRPNIHIIGVQKETKDRKII